MTTQVVFNIDDKLKKKAMKKSKKIGVPFSFVLNKAVKRFVEGEWEVALVEEKFNKKTAKEIQKALKDIKLGKNLSPVFDNLEDVIKYLKI